MPIVLTGHVQVVLGYAIQLDSVLEGKISYLHNPILGLTIGG